MIANGTKRKCQGGDHQITHGHGVWFHTSKADWIDKPHKASPRKYKRVKKNAGEEVQEHQTPESV